MISVNDLIQQAYTRTGLVGDGQSVGGTKAVTALHELKDLISMLNQQEYIADNIKMIDVKSNKNEITFGNSEDFNVQLDRVPSTIKSVGRKVGDRWIQLYKSNLESIYSHNHQGHSSQYTYNVSFDNDKQVLKGTITLDGRKSDFYKVCFIDDIDDIDLSSTLNLQDMYKSLLLTGLTYRLSIRYKLNEWVEIFKSDFDEQKSLIKRVNSSNRPIVWNLNEGSYLDSYYDGFCPEW